MSESSSESESNVSHHSLWMAIDKLLKRVRELEGEVEAIQRADNSGYKHPNDGGYFD